MNLQEIEQYLNNAALDVAEGEADPLEVYAIIQSIRKSADTMEKAVKEEAIERAMEYNADKEPLSYKGFMFTFNNGRSMPQFKEVPAWVTANKNQKRIEELAKLAAKEGKPQVDTETGEMVDPVPIKYSAASLSVRKDGN